MKTIGERIKYLRKKHKISQQQLATGAGVQRGNISHYEKGDWNPNYETTEKIAAFFGVNADWLFYGEENKFKNDEIPYTENKNFQTIDSSNELSSREFAERLKISIKSSNLTLDDLADKIGVSKNSVNNYVSGRIPGAPVLHKLSKVFGSSMEWLLTGEDPKKEQLPTTENAVQHILGELTDEEIKLIELFRQLNDRDKIKVEGIIEDKISESEKVKRGHSSTYQSGEEAATLEKGTA